MGLPDLYPAQVGSPYTTLAAPYTSGEGTMTLVDATKLPTAPNIVCLAGDVAGEFSYTGKEGNVLQGVTALPGTPAATTWPAGTFAFRGISAYDLNAIHENMVRTATYVVAASDAPAHVKQQADYVCDGTDDQIEIQAAIDALPTLQPFRGTRKVTLIGSFVKGDVAGIIIPSSVEIELQGSIRFVDNVGDGAVMFSNRGTLGENIVIVGGTLDGRRWNQSTGSQTAIQFTGVSNSRIDTTIVQFRGWNVREISPGSGNTIINRNYPNSTPIAYPTQDRIAAQWRTIDTFDTGWVCPEGVMAADVDEKLVGSQSIKVTIPAGGRAKIEKEFTSFSLNGRYIGFWLRVDNPANLLNMRVYVTMPDWTHYQSGIRKSEANIVAGKWIFVAFPMSSSTGSPDLSDCRTVRIQIEAAASGPVTAWIDRLAVAPRLLKRGVVILNFDDGRPDTYAEAFPRMRAYGYPGVVGIIGSRLQAESETHLSLDQLREMVADGWDAINHTWTHASGTAGDCARFEDELRQNQDYLISLALGGGHRFFRPRGNQVALSDQVDMLHKYAALTCCGTGQLTISASTTLPVDSAIYLKTRYLDAVATTPPTAEEIGDLLDLGLIVQFGFHGLSAEGGDLVWTTAQFEQLLANLATAGAEVVTLSDLYDRYLFREPYSEDHGAAASTADGGTIAHGCAKAPTVATVSGSVAGEIVTVTSIDATNITVAIKAADGTTPGTPQTVYWRAEV